MGALGRALATWLLAHGVTEDICGSTLEAKWLRGTDPNGRAGRASLVSLSDAWQSESGSGVRRFAGGVANTLPAPPQAALPGVTPQSETPAATRASGRRWVFGGLSVLVLGLAGFAFGNRLRGPSIQASTEPALSSERSAPPVDASPPAASIASGEAVQWERPASGTVTAPSAQQLARPANSGPRQVPSAPRKGGAGANKARSKPGDLMSPY
jgi:hypothetical protein